MATVASWRQPRRAAYPQITDLEMQAIDIARAEFQSEWSYVISPNQQPP